MGSFLQLLLTSLTASHALGDLHFRSPGGGLWSTSSHLKGRSATLPGHLEGGLSPGPDTHHKPTVDLLRNLLLIQGHGLPFLFLILFFSNRLQAYILPVARTWQAQT